jgi:hypothetical protein
MNTKKIMASSSDKKVLAKALSSSANERLDILQFVMGASDDPENPGGDTFACDTAPDFKAYADCTYVKK